MPGGGRKTLGLVLESGAARGLAHIGVLKVLDEAGLKPDVITGTSMGALVGAFYAAGLSGKEIEKIAIGFDTRSLMALADVVIGKSAMLNGDRVESFLGEHLPATFAGLRMPFGCVATDLVRGAPVRFTSGALVHAVRASISVPLIFAPVRVDDALYVDGFITDPLPISLAKKLGAEVILAVSVAGSGTVSLDVPEVRELGLFRAVQLALHSDQPHERGTSSIDIMIAVGEIVEREISKRVRPQADVFIHPDVRDISGFEFLAAPRAIAAGEAAAAGAVESIRRLLRS